jgi:hypothetical protein
MGCGILCVVKKGIFYGVAAKKLPSAVPGAVIKGVDPDIGICLAQQRFDLILQIFAAIFGAKDDLHILSHTF